jgi:hypothetical protein
VCRAAGVRPEVAFAQAFKETGGGRFGRAVTPAHRNLCGLKIRDPGGMRDDDPNAHARFPSWLVGVQAHVDHLSLYAAGPGTPREQTPDPRHFAYLHGRARSVEELGGPGKWAPSRTYGPEIAELVDRMTKTRRIDMPELPPLDELADEDDELDGCSVDMAEDPVSDEDLDYVVLSPEGDERRIREYGELFPLPGRLDMPPRRSGMSLELADRCREYGLVTVEVDGWRTRGSSSFNPGGVVAHHTAGATGDMPSLRVLIHGRSDLPGPLCNVGLSRSGRAFVIAAGRANHAGSGGWKGMVGNSSVFGIEAENRGTSVDPWPRAQLEAYYRLTAALVSLTSKEDVDYACGHKEWTTRKPDPHSLGMAGFREAVRRVASGPTMEEDDMYVLVRKDDQATPIPLQARAGKLVLAASSKAKIRVSIGRSGSREYLTKENAAGRREEEMNQVWEHAFKASARIASVLVTGAEPVAATVVYD